MGQVLKEEQMWLGVWELLPVRIAPVLRRVRRGPQYCSERASRLEAEAGALRRETGGQ